MTIAFPGLRIFLGVFVRLAGMLGFNPLFSRRNVPARFRAGMVLFLTALISGVVPAGTVMEMDTWTFAITMFAELTIGAIMGFIFQLFYYFLFFVGDILDTMFGMAMAKTFDPATNIQISITGNLMTIMFVCYYFLTDSHLATLYLFSSSFTLLPLGTVSIGLPLVEAMLAMFIQVFMLVIRLAMPFAVILFTLEVCMGILMKVIPQIHVFVINFQLKMAMGMLLLFLFAPYSSAFLDNYLVMMMDQLQNTIEFFMRT